MITIVYVGRVKNQEIMSMISEYVKRIERYSKIRFIEVKEEKIKKDRVKELEGERIINSRKQGKVICLDERGKEFSSMDFAKLLKGEDITFVIGGAFGLSEEVKACNMTMSLSKMTLTHEMAQLFLIEQVYRAFTILNNEEYHK